MHAVGSIMRKDLAVLPATRLTLSDLREFLDLKAHKGFPVVDSHDNMTLLGDIARVDLVVALGMSVEVLPTLTSMLTVGMQSELRRPRHLTQSAYSARTGSLGLTSLSSTFRHM